MRALQYNLLRTTLIFTTVLLWIVSPTAQAQEDHSYFKGRIPLQVEDRFNDCFEDLTASWIPTYIDSLLTIGDQKDGEPYLCMAHILQAYQYYLAEDSVNFFSKSNQALEETKALNCNTLYYNLQANQVKFYSSRHNPLKAQKAAELMIEEASKSNEENAILMAYMSMAVVHADNAEYKRSNECYEQVLKYLEKQGDNDPVMKAQMLFCIGNNFYNMGLYKRALTYLDETMKLIPSYFEAKLTQALCHFKTGEHATFLKIFGDLKKDKENPMQGSDMFIYARAMDLALTHNYALALATTEEMEEKAQQYFAASDIYSLMNDWEKAFASYRLGHVTMDSLRQENFSNLLASVDREINTAYQLYEKDELLRKNRMASQQWAFGFIILLLIFLGCAFYFRKRSQWQKKRIRMIQAYNAELSAAKEVAEEANRMKTMFLQNMSHDLRTPLNAIVGFSQLLGLPDGFNSEEDKEKYNSYISNNSEMLMLLFEDILNLGDIEKGNFKVEYKPTPCNDMCRKILKCVEYRVPPGVALNFTSNVDEDFQLNTDGRRVQQVIMNYLTNACKHTREGEICLNCQVNQAENTVIFSVTDTGEGVPEDMQDKLFERFVKLGEGDSHGLGLNICQTIAGKMNGTVSLDKSYKNGAKFDFKLSLR